MRTQHTHRTHSTYMIDAPVQKSAVHYVKHAFGALVLGVAASYACSVNAQTNSNVYTNTTGTSNYNSNNTNTNGVKVYRGTGNTTSNQGMGNRGATPNNSVTPLGQTNDTIDNANNGGVGVPNTPSNGTGLTGGVKSGGAASGSGSAGNNFNSGSMGGTTGGAMGGASTGSPAAGSGGAGMR